MSDTIIDEIKLLLTNYFGVNFEVHGEEWWSEEE
jgi:hypothetical protein